MSAGLASFGQSIARSYRANRALSISALTLASIVLIVWARLGFSFEIGRFFAAEPAVVPRTQLNAEYTLPLIDNGKTVYKVSWQTFPTPVLGGKFLDFNVVCQFQSSNPAVAQAANAILRQIDADSITVRVPLTQQVTLTLACTAGKQTANNVTLSTTSWTSNSVTLNPYVPTGGQSPTTPSQPTQPSGGTPGTFDGFCNSPADLNRPECACTYSSNRTNQCHVCTSSWKEGNTDYSDAQWQVWDNTGLCRPSCPANAPYETGRKKSDGTSFAFPQYCVEKPDDCPAGFHASGSPNTVCAPDVVAVAPTPTATPTPTLTSVPTPTSTPTPTASPTPTPIPSVTPTPTPTPVPSAGVTMTVSGRNISTGGAETTSVSAAHGQQVEVITRVTNSSATAPVLTTMVRAVLSSGVVYVPGSVTVNGQAASDALFTSGVSAGGIGSFATAEVRFRGTVQANTFPTGATSTSIVMLVTPGTASPISSSVLVTLVAGGQPTGVATGPGDAVVVALLISAITTLLYVSYAHSPGFRRKQIENIAQQKDPLDFRS